MDEMSKPQHRYVVDAVSHNPWATAAESLLTAAWYAMPDYVTSRKRRAAAKTAVIMGAGLYGAYLGQGLNEEDFEEPEDLGAQASDGEVVRQVLIVVAAGVVVGAGTIYFETLIRRAADGLRDRGVSRPNTVIGIVMGALTPLAQRGIQQATGHRGQS